MEELEKVTENFLLNNLFNSSEYRFNLIKTVNELFDEQLILVFSNDEFKYLLSDEYIFLLFKGGNLIKSYQKYLLKNLEISPPSDLDFSVIINYNKIKEYQQSKNKPYLIHIYKITYLVGVAVYNVQLRIKNISNYSNPIINSKQIFDSIDRNKISLDNIKEQFEKPIEKIKENVPLISQQKIKLVRMKINENEHIDFSQNNLQQNNTIAFNNLKRNQLKQYMDFDQLSTNDLIFYYSPNQLDKKNDILTIRSLINSKKTINETVEQYLNQDEKLNNTNILNPKFLQNINDRIKINSNIVRNESERFFFNKSKTIESISKNKKHIQITYNINITNLIKVMGDFKFVQSFNLIRTNYYIRLYYELEKPIDNFSYFYIDVKTEFLDISIPLFDDYELFDMSKNLDFYIIKGYLNYKQHKINIHYLTLPGTLLDMYSILLLFSNYEPWTDSKYEKRLDKFMSLICFWIKFNGININRFLDFTKMIMEMPNIFDGSPDDITKFSYPIYLSNIKLHVMYHYDKEFFNIKPNVLMSPENYLFNLFIYPIRKFYIENKELLNTKNQIGKLLDDLDQKLLDKTKLIFSYYKYIKDLLLKYLPECMSSLDKTELETKKLNIYNELQIGGKYYYKYLKYKTKYFKLKTLLRKKLVSFKTLF